MKKGLGGDRFILFSLFVIFVFAFLLLFFFIKSSATGHFVRYGTGPYYYNCSSCSDCNEAILNASSGDTIFLDNSVSTSGICINIFNKTGIVFDCVNSSIIGSGFGIHLINTNNSEIRNCGVSTSNGISLQSSSGNTLTNIVTGGNTGYGITLYHSNDTLLSNIYSISDVSAIYLYSSSGNSLTNVVANGNQNGITLVNSNNNLLSYSSIINSRLIGINCTDSDYNVFTNVNLNNDSTGLSLWTSDNNVLRNSRVEKNDNYGLFLISSYNFFYNNFFNNTRSYFAPDVCLSGHFNTTKTSATNIIGGSYTGGNFWGDPTGTGFSQNCTLDANNDKICDIPYNISCITFDYLPLIYQVANITNINCTEMWTCSNWSSCVNGIKTRTCTDYNICGTNTTCPPLFQNCTTSNQTVPTPSVTNNTFSNNTGASGTEGIGTNVTQNLTTVTPNNPAVINIDDSQIYLIRITLNVLESIQSASITITKVNVLSNATLTMGLPAGQFYQAFRVDTSGVTSSNIANVTIEFKVNKLWLASKNGTINGIQLYRRPDTSSQWNNLATSLTSQDSTYYYFTSVSPGFSTFAVFFESCEGSECGTGVSKGSILLYVVISMVGIAILITSYVLFRKIKKKKEPQT